jgi:hypothetical protein
MNVRAVAVLVTLAGAVAAAAAAASAGSSAHALLVGSWHGKKGTYTSIAAAVQAAKPGDWILVAPGDYREQPAQPDGVRITTPNVHIRGMSRTAVIVDGTRPEAPEPCAPQARWQNLGHGQNGRNGIVADAQHDSVDNLTVCNFVGGRHSQQVAAHGAFQGSFLTATSTFASRTEPAVYGISISHAAGPIRITNSYASNMADSALHIGGCADCNAVFDHDTAEHSVIAFTALDAGGRLTVEHSLFRDNSAGIDLASEEDDSSPPPQDGSCPAGVHGPVGADPRSCTIVENNVVDGNNDPNVPGGQGGVLRFIGAGVVIAGGRNDTVVHNTVRHQGAYGIVVMPYAWLGRPDVPSAHCQGGRAFTARTPPLCLFDAFGNLVAENTLSSNGTFGNPTNGDLADASLPHRPGNCFRDNTAVRRPPVTVPRHIGACWSASTGAFFGPLGAEIACAVGVFGSCDGSVAPVVGALETLGHALRRPVHIPPHLTARYPTLVRMTAPLPPRQQSMPNPCFGVPANAWCPG